MSLEDNGLDSLIHAVEHYLSEKPSTYLKYVVLHSFHAVELLLKARLERIDPKLIFRGSNIRSVTDDTFTVGFEESVKRLSDKGIELSEQDKEDLNALRVFRNRIEHRRFVADRLEVDNYIGQTMRFLDHFTREHLKINLREHLDETTYDTLIELLHGFQEAFDRAEQEMAPLLGPDWEGIIFTESIECPRCGNYMAIHPDSRFDPGRAQCFAPGCRTMLWVADCERCGQGVASVEPFDLSEPNICYGCFNDWMSRD